MLNFINNYFSSSKNFENVISEFKNLRKKSNVEKIFKAIENHSSDAEIRYVGGCVRKILNQEKVDDIDLATNLEPNIVKKVLEKNKINFYETGIEYGTITAIIKNEKYEITSLRSDISTDGRHAKVEFTKDWIKDAERRDFTINAIYSDIDGNLFDPFDGAKDLKNGKIIFVGNAERRIKEDYLRILRYIRFYISYSKIDHDHNIVKSINKNLFGISKISSDRLISEFKKILKNSNINKLYDDSFLNDTIKLIFPQFKGLIHFKKLHNLPLQKINELDFIFLLSLLIIDETDNADYFVYKFNISKKDQKRIYNIKDFYFKNKINKLNQKTLWKIFYKYGKETLFDILRYKFFTSKKVDNSLNQYLDYFRYKESPVFPIKGEDLMKKFSIPEGKKIGELLKIIENIWIENDFKITEEEIKRVVKD